MSPCFDEFRSENKGLLELCKELEELCYYVVKVSMRPGNPPFLAILYTGFSSGAYRSLYNGGSEVIDVDHRCVAVVVKRIGVLTPYNEVE